MKTLFFLVIRSFLVVLSVLILTKGFSQNQYITDSLKQEIKNTKPDTNRIILLLELGDQYIDIIPDTAYYYYQQSLEISREIKSEKFNAKCIRFIGLVYHKKGDFDKASDCFQKSLAIFEELGNKIGMANCYKNIGSIYNKQGSFDTAIICLNRSLQIYTELGDKVGITKCYNNIGTVYNGQGSYDMAIEYYFKSYKLWEEIGERNEVFGTLLNIGNVFEAQGSYNKAVEYYLESLKIAEEIGNSTAVSAIYHNIGLIKFNQGVISEDMKVKIDLYNESKEYYLNSLKISEQIGSKWLMSYAYSNMGNINVEFGLLEGDPELKEQKFDEAIRYFYKSLIIMQEMGDKVGIASRYSDLASINMRYAGLITSDKKQRNAYLMRSIDYGNKSFVLAGEINALPQKRDAAHVLLGAYSEIGQYKNAVEFADVYIALQDSLFKTEKTKAIHEMATKYESEKKQQKINLLKEENRTKQQKIKAHNYLLLSLVLLLIIMLGFAYQIRQKSQQRLHQMENELQKYILQFKGYTDKFESSSHQLYQKYDLSERESEILHLLSKGYTYSTIADDIFVSKNTVKYHIKNIYLKLDVKNKIEALNKIQN